MGWHWMLLIAVHLQGGHASSSWTQYLSSVGAVLKDQIVDGAQWVGNSLGLAHCAMPKDRAETLYKALDDPMWGLVGQPQAIKHIIRRYKHHQNNPTDTLVLVLVGNSGAGKTHTANVIKNSLYLTSTEKGGRQGFAEFVGGDYHNEQFLQLFTRRLSLAQEQCGTKGEKGNPVTVFMDELNELLTSKHAAPVISKIVNAMKDSRLSLDGDEVLDVRGWTFLFATDFQEQSEGGRRFREFTTRWVNQDVSVDTALLYTYEQDLTQMTQVMYDHHAAQYDRLQYSKLLNADNMVVFMPFGFRLARHLVEIMYQQSNPRPGFDGRVTLSRGLVDHIVDEKLSYETVTAPCTGDEGYCSVSGATEKVVKGGGGSIRNVWNEVASKIEAVLERFKTCKNFLSSLSHNRFEFCVYDHFVAGLGSQQEHHSEHPHILICRISHDDASLRQKELSRISRDISQCPREDIFIGELV